MKNELFNKALSKVFDDTRDKVRKYTNEIDEIVEWFNLPISKDISDMIDIQADLMLMHKSLEREYEECKLLDPSFSIMN